ncbi:MAG TPA: hypothetical protein ENN30_02270 [Candidatus Woesearchaeota archaeon]|nr:hypothetical protein [Candidatus Woesearchaeota archaeon]
MVNLLNFLKYLRKKAQGLPITTIVLIVIIVVVMVALLIWFFTSFQQSGAGVQAGIDVADTGIDDLSTEAGKFFDTQTT